MKWGNYRCLAGVLYLAGVLLCLLALPGQERMWAQEWASWGGDPGGMKYSTAAQIDKENVSKLQPAWTWHSGDVSDGSKYHVRSAFEATPLVVDGTMYVTTAFNRLVALEAETGRELWAFDPQIDKERSYTLFIHRGPAWWSDGERQRVLFGSIEGKLYSIDARTGELDRAFGVEGVVDLRAGFVDAHPGRAYGMTSPPAVFEDLVICGAWTSDGEPQAPSGDVRAFDVRTGKQVWRFHVVPREGEFGNETWEGDSWKGRGGANAWSVLSVDTERGLVFLPLTSPSADYYGGDRGGQNLFGDSLVALDARTGERKWHFQTVHHNIWDYDLPAQPNLIEVLREGKKVPAVAQVTKTGFTFVFHRETGEPLFPIEERPVPQGAVPGEKPWPTQPIPVKPPPFARQSMKREELANVDAKHRAFCEALVKDAVFGQLYTPIQEKPTVLFPGTNGGTNWGGASFDPESHTLYVNSADAGMISMMRRSREGAKLPFQRAGLRTPNARFWDDRLWPCQEPPWGHLTAIDMNTGEFRWRVVLGVVDELIEKGLPPTGAPSMGGSMVTAGGLVFIGASNDSRFRAFDKDSGKLLWETRLPASAHANPMTFVSRKTGKQYVVIAAGGGNKYNRNYADALIAYALPDE
jgi:quinoprotein glucose dehydrogenase